MEEIVKVEVSFLCCLRHGHILKSDMGSERAPDTTGRPQRSFRLRRRIDLESDCGISRPPSTSPTDLNGGWVREAAHPASISLYNLSNLAGSLGFKAADVADVDPPRFHPLRHPSDKVDMQQPVFKRGAFDLDVVGKIEPPLEGPRGNSLIKVVGLTFRLPAGDRQLACLGVMVMSSGANPAKAKLIWKASSPFRTMSYGG